MLQTDDVVKVILMPMRLYRTVIANKLNIVDITNYNKLKKIFSLNDFSEWNYFNTINIDKQTMSTCNLFDIYYDIIRQDKPRVNNFAFFQKGSLTQEDINDISKNIIPNSYTKDIKDNIQEQLNAINGIDPIPEDSLYKIIIVSGYILIILDNGFKKVYKENKQFKRLFLDNCLKTFNTLVPIHAVSKTNVFNMYLNHLQSEV